MILICQPIKLTVVSTLELFFIIFTEYIHTDLYDISDLSLFFGTLFSLEYTLNRIYKSWCM